MVHDSVLLVQGHRTDVDIDHQHAAHFRTSFQKYAPVLSNQIPKTSKTLRVVKNSYEWRTKLLGVPNARSGLTPKGFQC